MTCGKHRYERKRDANAARNARLHGKMRHGKPKNLRVYHCPDCNGWHLTKIV